jgi:predicted TPR repeat methyltransferase
MTKKQHRPRFKNRKRPASNSPQGELDAVLRLHHAGDLPGARAGYARLLARRPDDPGILFLLGTVLLQSGHLEQAEQRLRASLRLCPNHAPALRNLATVLMQARRSAEALPCLEQALRLDPDHALTWRGLADALAAIGRHEEADQAYATARRLWPADQDDMWLIHNQAVTLNALNRFSEAEALLRSLLRRCPEHDTARCNLGYALFEQGHPAQAREEYERCVQLTPGLGQARLGLAGCLESLDDLEQALEQARLAVGLIPGQDAWFRLGHVHQELGQDHEARQCYEQALVHDPAAAPALNNLGVLDFNAGNWEAAEAWFERAREADPDYPDVWLNVSNLREKQGRLEEAETTARKAVNLSAQQGSQARSQARPLARLGYILQRQGRLEEALSVFTRCIEIDPADGLGVALYLAGLGLREMPDRATDANVRQLFDRYAEAFESHLRQNLAYQGPELLLAALAPWLRERIQVRGGNGLTILDLGCGTGLCGVVLAPFAQRLDGVDLSPRMLAKAGKRGIYTRLWEGELTTALENAVVNYDCVTACDVFVYLGDLAPVFHAAHHRLPSGGLFAFTLETHAGDDVRVSEANRFQHGRGYLHELAQNAGFHVLHMARAATRTEDCRPVEGLVAVLRRV